MQAQSTLMPTGEIHPAADVFPMLSDSELSDLADDIKANGLLYPIILDADGRLIDGRNRLAACNIAGVQPRWEQLPDGVDPVAFILSTNITRRHLTKGQQAMAVAKVVLASNTSQAEAARANGINRTRVVQAASVLQYTPDLADLVLSGALGLDDAYRKAQARKADADSDESKLRTLSEKAPDLASDVVEGRPLTEVWATYQQRLADVAGQVKRDVEGINQLLMGWITLRTFEDNPRRDMVLAALSDEDRTAILGIEALIRGSK